MGKDNDAKGFNDQSDNLAVSSSGAGEDNRTGNGNGNGNGNGGNTAACEACFTDNLNPGLERQFLAALAAGITTGGVEYKSLHQICLAIEAGTLPIEGGDSVRDILNQGLPGGSNPTEIAAIIACLNLLFNTPA